MVKGPEFQRLVFNLRSQMVGGALVVSWLVIFVALYLYISEYFGGTFLEPIRAWVVPVAVGTFVTTFLFCWHIYRCPICNASLWRRYALGLAAPDLRITKCPRCYFSLRQSTSLERR